MTDELREALKRLPAAVSRSVAEMPDRSSPEDWPEAMLVTQDELTEIVEREIEKLLESLQSPTPAPEERETLEQPHADEFVPSITTNETAEPRCPYCGGNDKDMPCAYPSEGKPGCLRDVRLSEGEVGVTSPSTP